jgi:hypothetical protein
MVFPIDAMEAPMPLGTLYGLAIAVVAIFLAASVQAVELEMDENLEDLTRAKVAKQRAKMNTQRQDEDGEGDGAKCGNVDIGNVKAGKPGAPGPKEVIVVVKGDIINANNKCKN